MSNLRKAYAWDQAGFDPDRNLQILPIGKKTSFSLVAGEDLDVSFEGEDCLTYKIGDQDDKSLHKNASLSGWEKAQYLRRIDVSAKAIGSAVLRAKRQGSDWIAPLTIRVVADQKSRQVGRSLGEVTPELRAEIEKLSLRDAVIRIAEDQMHSAIASQSNGFGVYNIADDLNWCGAFAYWCWEQACAIKRESNPFGPKSTVLWSPQRAISYAMRDDTPVQLLRYAGEDPMTGKGKQEYREIGWAGCNLERADVVLYREGTASGWKHVCLVYEPSDSGSIRSIDGNQGQNDCIKIRTRSLDAKVAGGAPSLVFVHVGNAAGIS